MLIRSSRMSLHVMAALTAILMGTASTAQAGLLADNSGGAMPAFTAQGLAFAASGEVFPGSAVFNLFATMSATMDFAVFAPGPAFDAAFPGQDTSNGTHYVYAYQFLNLDSTVINLTVGLHGDEVLGTVGFIQDAGAVDPSSFSFTGAGPTSVNWDFNVSTPLLTSGLSSAVLFFTSANAPEFDTGSITADIGDTQLVPSPLPEPATLGLLLAGVGMMVVGKRRRA